MSRSKSGVPSFSNSKAILIVENEQCPLRTPKILTAIVYNIDIVGINWIIESQKQKKQLDIMQYLWHPKNNTTIRSKLFQNINFQFLNVKEFKNISIDDLKQLILRSGGQVSSKPEKNKKLVQIKCNAKFDRIETDYQLVLHESSTTAKNKKH